MGLLDRPEGTGTAATYHYRHLLQLLAVKIRQREGQSLDTIRAELKGVAGDALERRVATSLEPALANKADVVTRQDDDPVLTWQRVAVADGVELHVREDSLAADQDLIVAMREAVRAAIGRTTQGHR